MIRTSTLLFSLLMLAELLFAQNTRSIDGTQNNLQNAYQGAIHTPLRQLTANGYADFMSEPSGNNRPNPRIISNLIFSQADLNLPNLMGLSDAIWVWGQFIDHDITLVHDTENEPFFIEVPAFDPWFDPAGTGEAYIPLMRSEYDETTGTDSNNPRRAMNSVTAYMDASTIYGSDIERANWLRTFENGKLRTSAGHLLPFNTTTGEFNAPLDNTAPTMATAAPFPVHLFVAGDERANENPLLLACHTLFVREHNRLCDELAQNNPIWSDEQLYQQARRLVAGQIQSITYNEWLPAMGVHLSDYEGYRPSTDASITNVFSAAAFRLGHTLISKKIVLMDDNGHAVNGGYMDLRDAFFRPVEVIANDGIEPLFKGMATQEQQNMDGKMVDDLRNFLFGPPGAGGLDLAAINIARGRERGLADYNTIRQNMGIAPAQNFQQVNSDPATSQLLATIYDGDVNNIDAWVGMLTEEHMNDALFGETIMRIMVEQFEALRDGDRFWFERDLLLSASERGELRATTLTDIIKKNTSIQCLQQNAFFAQPHKEICYKGRALRANLDVSAFPNPTTGEMRLAIHSLRTGEATIQIFDVLGRVVQVNNAALEEGENIIALNLADNLPVGLYGIGIQMGTSKGEAKVLLVD